jgi:hypothetical protein
MALVARQTVKGGVGHQQVDLVAVADELTPEG